MHGWTPVVSTKVVARNYRKPSIPCSVGTREQRSVMCIFRIYKQTLNGMMRSINVGGKHADGFDTDSSSVLTLFQSRLRYHPGSYDETSLQRRLILTQVHSRMDFTRIDSASTHQVLRLHMDYCARPHEIRFGGLVVRYHQHRCSCALR